MASGDCRWTLRYSWGRHRAWTASAGCPHSWGACSGPASPSSPLCLKRSGLSSYAQEADGSQLLAVALIHRQRIICAGLVNSKANGQRLVAGIAG